LFEIYMSVIVVSELRNVRVGALLTPSQETVELENVSTASQQTAEGMG